MKLQPRKDEQFSTQFGVLLPTYMPITYKNLPIKVPREKSRKFRKMTRKKIKDKNGNPFQTGLLNYDAICKHCNCIIYARNIYGEERTIENRWYWNFDWGWAICENCWKNNHG